MSLRGANKLRTICEVLREIDDIAGENPEVYKRLVEAEEMAKKMARALYSYNKNFDAGWWVENEDYEKDLLKRMSAEYLSKRNIN